MQEIVIYETWKKYLLACKRQGYKYSSQTFKKLSDKNIPQ